MPAARMEPGPGSHWTGASVDRTLGRRRVQCVGWRRRILWVGVLCSQQLQVENRLSVRGVRWDSDRASDYRCACGCASGTSPWSSGHWICRRLSVDLDKSADSQSSPKQEEGHYRSVHRRDVQSDCWAESPPPCRALEEEVESGEA